MGGKRQRTFRNRHPEEWEPERRKKFPRRNESRETDRGPGGVAGVGGQRLGPPVVHAGEAVVQAGAAELQHGLQVRLREEPDAWGGQAAAGSGPGSETPAPPPLGWRRGPVAVARTPSPTPVTSTKPFPMERQTETAISCV